MKSFMLTAATLAAASALALLTTPALGQKYNDGPYYGDNRAYSDDGVIVIAPRHAGQNRDPATGARIETRIEQRSIRTADLDLRDDRDVDELYRRIDRTVAAACRSVERRLDVPLDTNRDCVRDAREDAYAQADRLIDEARG